MHLLSGLAIATGAAIVFLVTVVDGNSWLIYGAMVAVGASSMGWNGVHMAELARASPDHLIGDVTSGASLFGFIGSVCGPLFFAIIAGWSESFVFPFVLVAGQLVMFGLLALWLTSSQWRSQ